MKLQRVECHPSTRVMTFENPIVLLVPIVGEVTHDLVCLDSQIRAPSQPDSCPNLTTCVVPGVYYLNGRVNGIIIGVLGMILSHYVMSYPSTYRLVFCAIGCVPSGPSLCKTVPAEPHGEQSGGKGVSGKRKKNKKRKQKQNESTATSTIAWAGNGEGVRKKKRKKGPKARERNFWRGLSHRTEMLCQDLAAEVASMALCRNAQSLRSTCDVFTSRRPDVNNFGGTPNHHTDCHEVPSLVRISPDTEINLPQRVTALAVQSTHTQNGISATSQDNYQPSQLPTNPRHMTSTCHHKPVVGDCCGWPIVIDSDTDDETRPELGRNVPDCRGDPWSRPDGVSRYVVSTNGLDNETVQSQSASRHSIQQPMPKVHDHDCPHDSTVETCEICEADRKNLVLKLTLGEKAFTVMQSGEKNKEFRELETMRGHEVVSKIQNWAKLFTPIKHHKRVVGHDPDKPRVYKFVTFYNR